MIKYLVATSLNLNKSNTGLTKLDFKISNKNILKITGIVRILVHHYAKINPFIKSLMEDTKRFERLSSIRHTAKLRSSKTYSSKMTPVFLAKSTSASYYKSRDMEGGFSENQFNGDTENLARKLYPELDKKNVINFWSNGLAFIILLKRDWPTLINLDKIKSYSVEKRFKLIILICLKIGVNFNFTPKDFVTLGKKYLISQVISTVENIFKSLELSFHSNDSSRIINSNPNSTNLKPSTSRNHVPIEIFQSTPIKYPGKLHLSPCVKCSLFSTRNHIEIKLDSSSSKLSNLHAIHTVSFFILFCNKYYDFT
ncbi:hypothetical protein HZS_2138 [Henneguya salminicola]|nr:hypothetical protein HZS_2138 [Henneguya salminicola]